MHNKIVPINRIYRYLKNIEIDNLDILYSKLTFQPVDGKINSWTYFSFFPVV